MSIVEDFLADQDDVERWRRNRFNAAERVAWQDLLRSVGAREDHLLQLALSWRGRDIDFCELPRWFEVYGIWGGRQGWRARHAGLTIDYISAAPIGAAHPDALATWKAAGAPPELAQGWMTEIFQIEYEDAAAWMRLDLLPSQAAPWTRLLMSPADAERWLRFDFAPADAWVWEPERYEVLRHPLAAEAAHAGMSRRTLARIQQRHDEEEVRGRILPRWRAGYRLEDCVVAAAPARAPGRQRSRICATAVQQSLFPYSAPLRGLFRYQTVAALEQQLSAHQGGALDAVAVACERRGIEPPASLSP